MNPSASRTASCALLCITLLGTIAGISPGPATAQASDISHPVDLANLPIATGDPAVIPTEGATKKSTGEGKTGPWDAVEVESVWFRASVSAPRPFWQSILVYALYGVILLICLYTIRHYTFTFNRLFGRQRHPYVPIEMTDWPEITVIIAAHNEEAVINDVIEALLQVDYPEDRLHIMPMNDRSTDGTRAIIDDYVARYPGRIEPFHREGGTPGKSAALQEAMRFVSTEYILIFDADYVPGRNLIKQLVAALLDPEVGAVMGRVVPLNTPRNLLTRLMEMERSGGYQVDQQARMNLRLFPQYGGTAGGLRLSAVRSVGGWRHDTLTEDTDITYRLFMGGWKVVYSNRYECYEEVPEEWPVRIRQIRRWAKGHTEVAFRYAGKVFMNRRLRWMEKIDGILLLGVYLMAPILLFGWMLAIVLFYLGEQTLFGLLSILVVAGYNTIGNFAAFFEITAATHLDGARQRACLIPMTFIGFIVSMVTAAMAASSEFLPHTRGHKMVWDKTKRYRRTDIYQSPPPTSR